MRIRLVYSKRDGACFVPHIALAQIFSRAARRAGLNLVMTQGYSPRPKLSFAPELPAGVVALRELADIFTAQNCPSLSLINSALPEGFSVSETLIIPDDACGLGKFCSHAQYFIRPALPDAVSEFFGTALCEAEECEDWLRVIISQPAQNPIGGLVKHLAAVNIISGWHEINIVRASIGALRGGEIHAD